MNYLSAAVEGDVDEAVVHRLAGVLGGTVYAIYGKKGKNHLRLKVTSYNNAARFSTWLFLVDLDQEANCAPELVRLWLGNATRNMCFRVAVREVESWLLADAENLARFLHVARNRIPRDPELLPSPKRTLVDLARTSTSRAIREEIVPRPGSSRIVGPAYSSRVIQFIQQHWDPRSAERRSDSLRRCIVDLSLVLSD